MKLTVDLLPILLLLTTLLTSCEGDGSDDVDCSGVLHFAEPKFENAVRFAIDKPEGDIYASDVADLEVLFADRIDISDLTGIQCLTSLTELDISENQLTDISPVTGLSKLRVLYVRENQVSDISVLSGLSVLRDLNLDSNHISDIEVLRELTEMDLLRL